MKKTIVCIFAHPDDESFGPSGTIYKLAKENDVYIICATRGEAGQNYSDKTKKLAQMRASELRKSAKLLGVKNVYFLGFIDGTLSNSLYHTIADKIEKHLRRLKPETILTFEPHGISGHIDHIVVSRVSTFVFHKLPFIKTIMFHCLLDKIASHVGKNYFIHFGEGYKKSEINKIVDVSDVWDIKVKAMYFHKSQRHDADRILESRKNLPKEEYFLVKNK